MGRVRRELCPGQKRAIISAHAFIKKERKVGAFNGRDTRSLVAECIGVGEASVGRVLRQKSRDPSTDFEPGPSGRGRPRAFDIEDVSSIIREYLIEQNKLQRPVTAALICAHVKAKTEIDVRVRSMRRALIDMGFRHVRGKKRHFMAERFENIAYRLQYLSTKLTNRDANNNPIKCEVYLDESYCNVHHQTGKTWLTADSSRFVRSGKGDRVCMVAAGVVRTMGAIVQAKFVEDSIRYWKAKSKTGDYHGNFDAEQFERWFTDLCKTLKATYGPCIIHMDGASYHKRNLYPSPTTKWKVAAIKEWLQSRDIPYDPKDTKPKLLDKARLYKPEPDYAAYRIAADWGHQVLYTPPYHPELQPIELIWANIKNRIAKNPARDMADLLNKIKDGFEEITTRDWYRVFRHAQGYEDMYKNQGLDVAKIEEEHEHEDSAQAGECSDTSEAADDEGSEDYDPCAEMY